MKVSNKILLASATLVLGFMISLHLNVASEVEERDTRDLWEIRSLLIEEQSRQQELQEEYNRLETIKREYETSSHSGQINTLRESIQMLELEAGLTRVEGEGIVISLQPNYGGSEIEDGFPELDSELLNRLINELNVYGATAIAVEEERVVNHSAIRDVDQLVFINQRPIKDLPIEIRVLTDDANRLQNYMEVSQSKLEFSLQNIDLLIETREDLSLPGYTDPIQFDKINIIEEGAT